VFKRVVAWGDGWMPVRVTPEQVKMGRATLDELAEAAGRDPKSIRLMVYNATPDPDEIKQLEEAGADSATVSLPSGAGDETLNSLESLAEKLLR
jgi:hypothetical protein